MNNWIVMFSLLVVGVAVTLTLWERWKSKKLVDNIEAMLCSATHGDFSEEAFDESRLSKLETEFAHYLSSAQASVQATEQERDKIKTLIGDISHQTKTPISNLLLYSELLGETDLTAEQRSDADAIHQQAEKLRFLIDALVKLSRLENGILQLVPSKGAVMDVMQAVYDEMLPKAEQKGLTPELLPTNVRAVFDRKWTAEALSNLVDNAIKYTESGKISLSCTEYEMFVRLDVADTGIGIPEEEQSKIFGRFYRASQSAEQEGVGIGLYLTREILSAENGYIRVTSELGKGSVFSVFLPRD